MYEGLGNDPSALINAAFTLTTIGQFALLILIMTLLCSSTVYKRSFVLLNLLAISFLGTIPQYLLMYAEMIYNPKPPAGLCATQAALLEGVQCMLAMSSFSLVVDVLVESQVISFNNTTTKYLRAALIVIPYITFIALVSAVAAFGVAHPDQVRHMPNDLACTLHNSTFITALQIVISAIVVLTLSLMTYAIVRTLATRRHLPSLPTSVGWPCPKLPSFSQAARIVAFTCLQALLLVFNTVRTYVHSDGPRIAVVVLQALMPVTTFCIFGLTAECYHTWKRAVLYPFSRWSRNRPVAAVGNVPLEVTVTVEEGPRCYDSYFDRGPNSEKPIRIALDLETKSSFRDSSLSTRSESLKDYLVKD
ncbi:hypothetical protein BV20DRAFT_933489 [Pilatotrama ljubarskyi]|nr:hypothetical protein BV20DRAFT_933489 [Pilatotrama ljubarskyi]